MRYYVLESDPRVSVPSPLVYDRCLNFDHSTPEAVCPLCGRRIAGSRWLGPYELFTASPRLPEMMLAGLYDCLVSQVFLDAFRARGLSGIGVVGQCRIFYRKQAIEKPYFMASFSYSQKAMYYARERNALRAVDKSLPRCSLCMGGTREKDQLYFDGVPEYDVFKKYDNGGKDFCTEAFREFCTDMKIPGLLFRPGPGF